MADNKTQSSSLALHPEFLAFLEDSNKDQADLFQGPEPTNNTESQKTDNFPLRAAWDVALRDMWRANPPKPPPARRTVYQVPSLDGTTTISMTRFDTTEPVRPAGLQPAWLFLHGGGVVAGSVDIYAPQLARLAVQSGMPVFGVDFRLAPEHPAPTPGEDCFAALAWLSAHAAALGVDPARIGVMGDSGGGGLAAGTALRARDHGLRPPLARQMLIYPMLDDRIMERLADPEHPLKALASVDFDTIAMLWRTYLGEKAGAAAADISPYDAPARATDLRGLAPAYIDIGNIDLFRDETATYAARLLEANVDVEFHVYSGLPHGFEIAWDTEIAQKAMEARIREMKRL